MTLKYTLVVRHPETGDPVALRAGEDVPKWASDLVHKDDQEPAKQRARGTKQD